MAHLRTVKRNQDLKTRVSNPRMSIGAYDQSPHQHPYDSNSVASTLVVNTNDLNPRLTDASVLTLDPGSMHHNHRGMSNISNIARANSGVKSDFKDRFQGRHSLMNKDGHIGIVKNTNQPIKKVDKVDLNPLLHKSQTNKKNNDYHSQKSLNPH